MDKLYVEQMQQLEGKEESTFKSAINNMPIESMRSVLIVGILAVVFMVWTKQLPMKALYWLGGGIAVILILMGMQQKNKGADITEAQAKSIVKIALWRKKNARAREFDGLDGDFDVYGPCHLDNRDQDGNKWEWLVGWYHRRPNGRVNYYTAAILSKVYLAKISSLTVSPTKYLGESLPEKTVVSNMPSARNVTYNITPNQQPMTRYP